MNKSIIGSALALAGIALTTSVLAGDLLVRFDGGVGVHPVAGIANGAPVLNTVRNVPPGGRPWAIQRLDVSVMTDGRIFARGEGLVLGGGDAIGTRGGALQVAAQLFCGAAVFTSPAVPLSVGGDFQINAQLDAVPPSPCGSPALLIRNATGGTLGGWFAAGTLVD